MIRTYTKQRAAPETHVEKKQMHYNKKFLATLVVLALTGCGGGNDPTPSVSPTPTTNTQTGIFTDSAVAGLHYVSKNASGTTTRSGTTNASGEYRYESGDSVTFSIGGITFPPVTAKSRVTPLDVAGTDDIHNTAVVNIARLLQTLDSDGDPSNGIKIGDAAHTAATGMSDLNFAGTTFDTAVTNLVANSGSKNTALVDADSAIKHFTESTFGIKGGIPSKFSVEWLSGRTLYLVWFGTPDESGNPNQTALARVTKMEYGDNNTVTVTGLLNIIANHEAIPYSVVDGVHANDGTWRDTICDSSSKYVKARVTENADFVLTELFFFNEANAMAYAATLTKPIEPCKDRPSPSPTTPSPSTPIDLEVDVEIVGQSKIVGSPIKMTFSSCGGACTETADLFCTPPYEVGERESFVGRLALNSLSGTATLSDTATLDQASGTYDSKTQSVLLTEVIPKEEVTPANSSVRYFSEGTLRIEANVDLATKVVTGMVYDTVATSWELDSRKVECSSIATFISKPKK